LLQPSLLLLFYVQMLFSAPIFLPQVERQNFTPIQTTDTSIMLLILIFTFYIAYESTRYFQLYHSTGKYFRNAFLNLFEKVILIC
jgi:hypothetical protein